MVRGLRLALFSIAIALGASAPALADQSTTLKVPISLTGISPAVQSFRVSCNLATGAPNLPALGFGNSTLLPLSGSYSGVVNVPIGPFQEAQLLGLSSLNYVCRVAMFAQPPSAFSSLGPPPAAELTDLQYGVLLVQPATLFVKGSISLTGAAPTKH